MHARYQIAQEGHYSMFSFVTLTVFILRLQSSQYGQLAEFFGSRNDLRYAVTLYIIEQKGSIMSSQLLLHAVN